MILVIQNDLKVPPGLIGEGLRHRGIPHRLVRLFAGEELPRPEEQDGIIVLGGYMGVHDEADYPFLRTLKGFLRQSAKDGPLLLGICLGGQLLAEVLGGRVTGRHRGEKGVREVRLTAAGGDDPLFRRVGPAFPAFQWHNDSFDLPPGAVHLAATPLCPGQAFRFRSAYGLQFHPEVDEGIVDLWSEPIPERQQVREAFRAHRANLRILSDTLLDNFLALTPLS